MTTRLAPVAKRTLADNLAAEIKQYIVTNGFYPGQKLPSTTQMAQQFGVGLPTVREAIKKLETAGAIDVRHGSGMYVGKHIDSFFLINPIVSHHAPTQKHLLDLVNARIPIELETVALASQNATADQLAAMTDLLTEARDNLGDDRVLNMKNMAFHKAIAEASGNSVFLQILDVMTNLFQNEQRIILDIYRSRETDYRQHVEIFEAIKARDSKLAVSRMRAHLEGVRTVISQWHGPQSAEGSE